MPPASHHRARVVLGELLRFLTVGGVATVVSVLGFNALAHGTLVGWAPLAHWPITAFVLANVVAGLIAYAGMRLWAFSDRRVEETVQSLVRFFVLGALTMAIPVVCLAFSRYVLGRSDPLTDNLSANVIGLGLGTAARFWVFRRFVFLEPGPPPETVATPPRSPAPEPRLES
ncbi:GtrA family protein [Nocardioides sp. GXQ0305]|uniref:GtrA family protein n=1 Tax=Nocardioides sp. GXQ0305 TaxID=3423912 RepID=UPI003D7CDADC